MNISELQEGEVIDLGTLSFTEEEIIDFASRFDPLEFHTNKEVAAASPFKGIIASGPHPFNEFYRERWIPLFGHTVIAGMELNHWKLLKPVYPGQELKGEVKIAKLRHNEERQHSVIVWDYSIMNNSDEPVQTLQVSILHKMD